MKRQVIGIVLASILALSLVGCGSTPTSSTESGNNVQEEHVTEPQTDIESGVSQDYIEPDNGNSTQNDADEPAQSVNTDSAPDNEAINFFIDRNISNNDRLIDLLFTDKDEAGNPSMLYAKGGNHSEITLCNYQIVSGSIDNCSKENSIIIYADCLYNDNDSDPLCINMYPSGEGNTWEMMITSPSDLEGFYSIGGDGPAVTASNNSSSVNHDNSSYWFVNYTFTSDDEESSFKLISDNGGDPTKIEIVLGDPYYVNNTFDIDSFSVQQHGSMYTVTLSYMNYDSSGEPLLSALDFDCQDGEAQVSAPGNMVGHYKGF